MPYCWCHSSQIRLLSLGLIEHSRIFTDFLGTGRPRSKQRGDFSLIITKNDIISLNITEIQVPQWPNLAHMITVLYNWSEWTNQITLIFAGYETFSVELGPFGVFFVETIYFRPKLAVSLMSENVE